MLKPRTFFVPAILCMLPTTVLLEAQVSLAEPNGCRTKPGSSAPPGTHWLYRVNPLDNQRCWFLSDKGVKAQLRARDGTSPRVPARPTRRENDAEVGRAQLREVSSAQVTPSLMESPQEESVEAASIDTTVGAHEVPTVFAARWPDLPKPLDLDGRELGRMSNAVAEELPDFPLIRPEPAGMVAFMPGISTAALFVLLLAGAVFMLGRRRQSDHNWRAAADTRRPRQRLRPDFAEVADGKSESGGRRGGSVWQPRTPTDPAHDLKASLRELMGDLQRARAASAPPRSFAPPAVHRVPAARRPVPDWWVAKPPIKKSSMEVA
jgi:hypothetical protein